MEKQRLKHLTPVDPKAVQLLGQADRREITVKAALTKLGIAPAQCSKGWSLVKARKPLRDALAVARTEAIHQLGSDADMTTEQEKNLIVGRLRSNIRAGEDRAVASAKLLGSKRDLNLWTPEVQQGVIIMTCPSALDALDSDGPQESLHEWNGNSYVRKSAISQPKTLEADTATERESDELSGS